REPVPATKRLLLDLPLRRGVASREPPRVASSSGLSELARGLPFRFHSVQPRVAPALNSERLWSVPQSARWLMTACETATDRGTVGMERTRHGDQGRAR